ncbi:uncharacterized protein SOCG_04556 [Schizosaccharomyces octosporus yFS286]|uniref:Uncharacterized protein n=1 Tax=Schizosaccharomyces octosporus (strain yFS286) TaxID=483514 RepID=S9Q6P4_SCHOY|nr:uncharacterized protein SOCG_04556 [Schizosaccharomyces octosporus yFS286]EPX75313.1 hypothetical protein SOCG_04556 [Schizosaccharomyces octosporus yFS286]
MGQVLSICHKKPKNRNVDVEQIQNRSQQPSTIEKPIQNDIHKQQNTKLNSGRKLTGTPTVSSGADLPPAEAARLAAEKRSEIHKEKMKTRLPKATFY